MLTSAIYISFRPDTWVTALGYVCNLLGLGFGVGAHHFQLPGLPFNFPHFQLPGLPPSFADFPLPGFPSGFPHFQLPGLPSSFAHFQLPGLPSSFLIMLFCVNFFVCQVPIELAASNHFNYRHLVKVASHHDHQTRMTVCAFVIINFFLIRMSWQW